jgi:deoxyadenosine kinase
VQDRTIYEDAVFASMLVKLGLMEERDYRTYLSLFRHMSHFMCRPNLIVYLDVKPERSMERVKLRSRNVETGLSLEYLTALYAEYEEFIEDIARTVPVIRVDWDRFHDVEEMAQVINQAYLHSSFLRQAKWSPTKG